MISPNHDQRPDACPIDHLVLHYTGMRSATAAIARLCDPAAKVSSHYLLDEEGAIIRLVCERQRAWHAGVSFWRGTRALNDRSIGIEIVNPGHQWGYRRYPAAQIAALGRLCHEILARHAIPPHNIVGHADIAPDRKQDPGELFPWRLLAAQGIGLWTDERSESHDPLADLASIGYDIRFDRRVLVAAFQRRFRPDRCDGILDDETAGRIGAISRLFAECA